MVEEDRRCSAGTKIEWRGTGTGRRLVAGHLYSEAEASSRGRFARD